MAGLEAVDRVIVALALVVSLAILVQLKAIHSVAGPFRIVPGIVEQCPPELQPRVPMDFYARGVRDRKNHDLWFYSGNFTTRFTWTNDHDVDVNCASWSSRGGWKDNYYILRMKHYCDLFKTYAPNMYSKARRAVDNPYWDNCTFPPGVYHVRNMSTDVSIKALPTFFYGKWRLTVRLMANGFRDSFACLRVHAETVPRV